MNPTLLQLKLNVIKLLNYFQSDRHSLTVNKAKRKWSLRFIRDVQVWMKSLNAPERKYSQFILFLFPVFGPKIPTWIYMPVAHRNTDQSGLFGRGYDIQRHWNRSIKILAAKFFLSCFTASRAEVFPKPLLTRATSHHQTPGHSQNSSPVDQNQSWFVMVSHEWFAVFLSTERT